MRLCAWLSSPTVRKNVLQTLVLMVLVANVAVSRPFQELWRQLRSPDTVVMAVSDVDGGAGKGGAGKDWAGKDGADDQSEVLVETTPHRKVQHEICGNCSNTCIQHSLPKSSDHPVETPIAMLPLFDMSPELKQLMSEPIINPYNYGFLHNPSDLCKDDTVDIIIFISTRPEDVYRRREIREDKLGLFRSIEAFRSIEPLFVMGVPRPDDQMGAISQLLVNREAKKYRDIVQVNFTDVPSNVHLKSVSILRWSSSYCRALKYVIHITEDVIVETKIIYALRYIGKRHENFILGQVERQLPVASYPQSQEFFKQDYLPPFVRKGLIGYPVHTARLLYEATLRVKAMALHDVYVTGICAPRVGAELLEDRRFRFDVIIDDESGELI